VDEIMQVNTDIYTQLCTNNFCFLHCEG